MVNVGLACGGVERVISLMANYWAAKSWRITILTLDHGDTLPFFTLHPTITHRDLGIFKRGAMSEEFFAPLVDQAKSPALHKIDGLPTLIESFQHILMLRRAIVDSKPQVVISFIDSINVYVLLATQGLDLPVI